MRNEAYLDKAFNASDGVYYFETLTRQFAEAALDIFNKIESGGAFLKQLEEGVIQQMIRENAEKEQQHFDNGDLFLIGTNKFQNPEDQMEKELDLDPFQRSVPGVTVVEPILENRLSEKSEQERLSRETLF